MHIICYKRFEVILFCQAHKKIIVLKLLTEAARLKLKVKIFTKNFSQSFKIPGCFFQIVLPRSKYNAVSSCGYYTITY